MPNPKGNPESLKPFTTNREKPLEGKLSFRVTKEMEESVKAQDDPAQFCRDAIQEKLDKQQQSD